MTYSCKRIGSTQCCITERDISAAILFFTLKVSYSTEEIRFALRISPEAWMEASGEGAKGEKRGVGEMDDENIEDEWDFYFILLFFLQL